MAAEHAENSSEMVMSLPSFLELMGFDMHKTYWGYNLHQWEPIMMSFMVGLLLVLFSMWATRRMEKIPRGAQAFLEIVVESLYNLISDTLGKETARYLPFLGSVFLYILLMNLWGLVPAMHSPTDQINTTLSLALVVFVLYNLEGLRRKKLGYFKHYFQPYFMAPLMFPLHVIGEAVRPVALSVRLFGNLTGKKLVLALLVALTPFIFGIIPVPLHVLMVLLAILFSLIQALIFTLLSAIYLALAVEEGEH